MHPGIAATCRYGASVAAPRAGYSYSVPRPSRANTLESADFVLCCLVLKLRLVWTSIRTSSTYTTKSRGMYASDFRIQLRPHKHYSRILKLNLHPGPLQSSHFFLSRRCPLAVRLGQKQLRYFFIYEGGLPCWFLNYSINISELKLNLHPLSLVISIYFISLPAS